MAEASKELRHLIQKVSTSATLVEDEIRLALGEMTEGHATPAQMGAFLMALRVRGETVEEITGAAQMLRARMHRVSVPAGAVDIVGTGGDSHGTFNVSTCASIIAAGAGLPIAKHGNRRVSSLSGASDVLTKLGVKVDLPADFVARCVNEAGIGFMWAPLHHPAMKHWAPIRAELGIRTIFNLLGPISNPAGVKRQVVGVFSWHWVEPIAHVLKNLGAEHVWVVHGHDGLDELSTTGPSDVAELKDGKITVFEVKPSEAGLATVTLDDLKGGDEAHNAQAIRDVLAGARTPLRDIAILNAAAALLVGAKAETLAHGAELATRSIESGAAQRTLDKLVAVSNAG
jgi:anthranilate phosphoribosyltransferase